MSVSPITGTSAPSAAASAPSATAATSGIGQDAFLQLLVTQLQYQDPTSPQDSTQFVQQLATFTSLEKLTDIDSQVKTLNQFFTAVGASAAASTTPATTPASTADNSTSGGSN